MLRIALLISLLISLIVILGQLKSGPVLEMEREPATRAKARSQQSLPGKEDDHRANSTPQVMPDVYDGYLFVEERKLDEADFGEFGQGEVETSEETAASLEQLFYAGSLIIGARREALVTYQEAGGAGSPASRRPVRGRPTGRSSADTSPKSKVLVPGERFLGFLVAAIEPEKIVFEKNGEKVEKYLFDQNKKRTGPSESPHNASASVTSGISAPITVSSAVSPVPPAANQPPSVRGVASPPVNPIPAARRERRSQRLLRANPAIGLPKLPVPTARPVPSNN